MIGTANIRPVSVPSDPLAELRHENERLRDENVRLRKERNFLREWARTGETAVVDLDNGKSMTIAAILDAESFRELCTVCRNPECHPEERPHPVPVEQLLAEWQAEVIS